VSTFIKAHLGTMVAADFFTVEAVSLSGLIRFHVLRDRPREPDGGDRGDQLAAQRIVDGAELPPRSPDLNAYAERFVLSIRSECLNRIVSLGE
jgi:hypothetical protein